MATSVKTSSILPLAAGDHPVKAEEELFKGSAMTKRGAQASISYMTCAALTQTICGNLKGQMHKGCISYLILTLPGALFVLDLFTISLGWVVFGGLPFNLLNVIGQLLGFIGSGLYAFHKLIGK